MVNKPRPEERDAPGLPTRIPFAQPHSGSQVVPEPPPEPNWQPRAEPNEVAPPRSRKVRVRVLSGAAVAVILVAGSLWWSQTRTASEVTTLPPPDGGTQTMRITAPATGGASVDSSAKTGGSTLAPTERVASAPRTTPPPPATRKATPQQNSAKGAVNTSARNLALNSKATASSNEGQQWPPAAAVDGDPATRWSSGFSDPQWLRVDLGKVWQINEVSLNWENAHATAYRVELSTDLRKWKSVFSTTSGESGVRTFDVAARPARYVRVYGLKRSTEYGYSLLELEVR